MGLRGNELEHNRSLSMHISHLRVLGVMKVLKGCPIMFQLNATGTGCRVACPIVASTGDTISGYL